MKKARVEQKNAIRQATDPYEAEIPLTPAVSSLVDLLVEMAYRRIQAVELPSTTLEIQKK